jgi:hypothetical protein
VVKERQRIEAQGEAPAALHLHLHLCCLVSHDAVERCKAGLHEAGLLQVAPGLLWKACRWF